MHPLSSYKNLPPTFSMVHLLHRLYGVDAPEGRKGQSESSQNYPGTVYGLHTVLAKP